MTKFNFLLIESLIWKNWLCEKPTESNGTLENTDMNPSEPTLNCEDCKFQTISETNLEKHKHEYHKLICDYCDFVGKSIGGLKTHTRRMHSTANNCYLCVLCT